MKFLSAAFIVLLTSVSGAALAAGGQSVAATTTGPLANYTDEQKSAESSEIHCACKVPIIFA